MDNPSSHHPLFHEGELTAQKKAGTQELVQNFAARAIRSFMPLEHRDFFASLPFVILGHADAKGQPWASFLWSDPGFIESPHDRLLFFKALPHPHDPLQNALKKGTGLGLLGIEFHTRRRNRASGHIAHTHADGFELAITQSFGNCPQYIQRRSHRLDEIPAPQSAQKLDIFTSLPPEAMDLIEKADCFFVASTSGPDFNGQHAGADVSHRGGKAGFVRVDRKTGRLSIPDYAGNGFFNTIGNFTLHPKAGLIFFDFDAGHILSLTGSVTIDWQSVEVDAFYGAERLWHFELSEGRFLRHATARPKKNQASDQAIYERFSWSFLDFSPNSLLTGDWGTAAKQIALREAQKTAHSQKETLLIPCRLKDKKIESPSISSFILEAIDQSPLPRFEAGAALTVYLSADEPLHGAALPSTTPLQKTPASEKQIIRAYSLSSAPEDPLYRISVKREDGYGEQRAKNSASHWLHRLEVGAKLFINSPAPSAFALPDLLKKPKADGQVKNLVFIAGGIGITPFLSLLRHLVFEGLRTRFMPHIHLIYACRHSHDRAFMAELEQEARRAQGRISLYPLLSDPHEKDQLGRDYSAKGRISRAFLQAILPIDDYHFYLCGPTGFMQHSYDILRGLGVLDKLIYTESFGENLLQRDKDPQDPKSTPPSEPHRARTKEEARKADIIFTGLSSSIAWDPTAPSLLSFAENMGLPVMSGCRSGRCGSCKARLIEGAVIYQNPPFFPLEEGEILLCSSKPAKQIDSPDNPRTQLTIALKDTA